jgi:nitrile hydratase
MDGIADLGGTDGWGPARPPSPDEPVFGQPWEGRAFAMTLLAMGRISGRNLDAFRHALERLNPGEYFEDGYYGRWLHAAELMLVESAILAPDAVDARMRNLSGEHVEEPAAPEPNKPDYAPTAAGSLRTVEEAPTFTVGESVRAKDMSPAGHTRLPGYVRGHSGRIESIQPAHLLPDTHAHFEGENPQHVYTVSFDSQELWGTDAEPFRLTIEMFETYLEKAA